MNYKVAVETFGCRLNQAESAVFVRQFTEAGYDFVADAVEADLCIINTCTLTSQATAKCRRLVRSLIRRNPDLCIAAVGCYAQTGSEELRSIAGLDYIVGTSDKMRLTDIISSPDKLPEPVVVRGRAARERFTIDSAGHYPLHTRANLKIQEGCNFVCSFCIIPRSRGPARSRDFEDIVREARVLVREGHREIIITGVNVGTYDDLGRSLVDVVDALDALDGLDRIRLSSIEPTTIDDGLIERMADPGSKLCAYLHIPLQSGDDNVLATMRRRYTVGEYTDFIDEVVRRVPDVGLGTDVIVGMPGETRRAFERTCRLVERIPFVNTHVFSFSARPGTGAYRMADPVPADVIAERSRLLHRIAAAQRRRAYESQRGRHLRVLFERRESDHLFVGFSDNYVKVAVESNEDLSNRLGSVIISGMAEAGPRRVLRALGELNDLEPGGPELVAHGRYGRAV